MEEYADIYYVDTRNARDHRPGAQSSSSPWPFRPRQPAPMPATRTVYVPPAPQQAFAQAQMYPPQAPIYPPQAQMYPPQAQVIYGSPQPMAGAAALFGRLTTGQLVEMVAQVFAAVQSLPGAPVATRDIETDLGNLILYQSALASHAKRDEQVRTLGGLVAKLVG